MNRNMTGQYIPGNSPLHKLDARTKFFGFLILIAAIIVADSIPGCALMLVCIVAIGYMSSFSIKTVLGSVRRLFFFFVIVFLMNAFFFTSDEPIWHWTIFTLSTAGIKQGLIVVFRVVLIMVLANALTLTTPPMGIMSAIETMVSPLRYIKIPAEEIAMILSVAIQFIPTLLEETDVIKKAQIARGARFESKKLHERAMAMLPLIVPIFMSAFKKADELAMAMEARGYRGAKHRTKKERIPMDRGSWIGLLACVALCAVEVVIRIEV